MAQDTEIPPNASALKVVSLATNGQPKMSILVQTQREAVKETGPAAAVASLFLVAGVLRCASR